MIDRQSLSSSLVLNLIEIGTICIFIFIALNWFFLLHIGLQISTYESHYKLNGVF